MTQMYLRPAFIDELVTVAPDIDPGASGAHDHLQDDLVLDSTCRNLVGGIHCRFGLPIPETDNPRLASPAKAAANLAELGAT